MEVWSSVHGVFLLARREGRVGGSRSCTVDSKKLGKRPGTIYAGFPSFFEALGLEDR